MELLFLTMTLLVYFGKLCVQRNAIWIPANHSEVLICERHVTPKARFCAIIPASPMGPVIDLSTGTEVGYELKPMYHHCRLPSQMIYYIYLNYCGDVPNI